MIEVQGEVDHLMALRVRNYVDNHHMELWRGRRSGRWTAWRRCCRS